MRISVFAVAFFGDVEHVERTFEIFGRALKTSSDCSDESDLPRAFLALRLLQRSDSVEMSLATVDRSSAMVFGVVLYLCCLSRSNSFFVNFGFEFFSATCRSKGLKMGFDLYFLFSPKSAFLA